jgi:predicted DNA-binding transcriptional regulator AlpA
LSAAKQSQPESIEKRLKKTIEGHWQKTANQFCAGGNKMNRLPETGFLRINQIIGDKTTPAIIPISKSSWWAGVKEGRFPQPVKLGRRTTAWRVADIITLINNGVRKP